MKLLWEFNTLLFISRYKLPIVIVIVNNNGIYGGLDKNTMKQLQDAGEATQV